MFKQVDDIESLFDIVDNDKQNTGMGAFTENRYPVRFVLFDNFSDCYQFVSRMSSAASTMRISQTMDLSFPDIIIGFNRLAQTIDRIIEQRPASDLVLVPVSELARFYENNDRREFDSLISTIKSIENDKLSFERHRRVYIPLVGLEGKMSRFYNDSQSIVWYLKNGDSHLNYRLVLTDGTHYGVNNLASKYTCVDNVRDWLNLWSDQLTTKTIICSSKSIFANADNANPDNAFDFAICNNAYEFMTSGLNADLSFLDYDEKDDRFWSKLAKEIDAEDFQFEKFFNSKFDIHELANYNVFLKTWFQFRNEYERWLLAAYYRHKFCNNGYICRALEECHGYTDVDFVESIATTIFNLNNQENYIEERSIALKFAAEKGIKISNEREQLLSQKLSEIAADPMTGYHQALRYVSTLTFSEKALVIEWLGNDKIRLEELLEIYPELYFYLGAMNCDVEQEWINKYVDEYRKAKICNKYTEEISSLIGEHNGSESQFYKWYQSFSTTRTILDGRDDIEVFYWIDGLGIDWIPFVTEIIKKHNDDNFYLNEVIVSKSLLPTKTSSNKESLEKLSSTVLPKIGDIDEKSHKTRPFPKYLIDDFDEVRIAIEKVLNDNPGRKIAIVSDHGISYLSQFCNGLNLSGITSDHGGRVAVKNNGSAKSDSKYIILEDKKTLCALRHESLCAKIGTGSGCHGGCTPEEALVPIFIISNQKTVKTWTAVLDDLEVSTASPFIHFTIKGLDNSSKPIVIYNGHSYPMTRKGGNKYETDSIVFVTGIETLTLKIGTITEPYNFKIKSCAEEDDLFA